MGHILFSCAVGMAAGAIIVLALITVRILLLAVLAIASGFLMVAMAVDGPDSIVRWAEFFLAPRSFNPAFVAGFALAATAIILLHRRRRP